jgi:hypothetical protein
MRIKAEVRQPLWIHGFIAARFRRSVMQLTVLRRGIAHDGIRMSAIGELPEKLPWIRPRD